MTGVISAESYHLLGELASGGMATVFLGRRRTRRSQAQLVAIKSMRQELAEDDAFATMFLDEATLTARIKHPNVVQTLDVASEGGKLLIVMEYVEGVALSRLIELGAHFRTPMPPRVAVAIVCDLLRGLHAAHDLVDGNGRPLFVVHRDVSPQNVLVGTDGVARILDFGVAKASSQRHVTMRGEIKGKLAYMPPEQALGEMVDRRSDIYAAGVVLWESLVGRRLFAARSEEELIAQIFDAQIDPPSLVADEEIPSAVDHIVLRALSRDRESRWSTAKDMADSLAQALSPAHRDEVTAYLRKVASSDLAARERHVRHLEENAGVLDAETQTLQHILTGRAARSTIAAPVSAPPPPPTPRSLPPPVVSSRSRLTTDSRQSEKQVRREERRRRRRMRLILGFTAGILLILALMALALFLGRHAR